MKVNFIMLFITAFCSAIVGGEQHNKKDTVDVSMVIKHYKMFEKEMEIHSHWPKEPFKSYPQTQMLKEKVDSIKEVTSLVSSWKCNTSQFF